MRLIFGAVFLFVLAACQPNIEADYIIENGAVFLGDETPAHNYIVAIKNEDIIYVGEPIPIKADQRINALGHYVVPGFVDPHTHSLGELTADDAKTRSNENYLRQGVTTVFNGNDGFGSSEISKQMQSFEGQGIGTNTALFIGHGALRQSVMGGEKRAPTPLEFETMKTIIEQGMEAGALGLSTGLFYAPGIFAETEEVVALAKITAKYGGVYDSHIRDEATYNIGLEQAIEEVIQIAEEADIAANIAHIKALGVDVWGQSNAIISKVEAARKAGLKITADQYPWQASGTRISNALLPRWVKAGSPEDYQKRLNDPQLLDRIKSETSENLRKRGGAEAVLITQDKKDWLNKTLAELSEIYELSPVDMAIKIAREGDARIASFNMSSNDIETFMSQSWVMTSSDGSSGHPRKFASYPKKYRDYVVDKNLMSLESFFYRSSGLVADTFNICNRGFIRSGFKADIAVINPETFAPMADYQNPEKMTIGVEYLFVNGSLAINDGQLQSVLSGKPLKRCETRR